MNVDRPARHRTVVAEHLHAVDQRDDAVGLVADQPGQHAVLGGRRLLQQLRRAADAGQRILDLMRQHRGQRDHRARGAAMRELAVHLVGDGALLQHHDDMAGPLGQRRDVQVDLAVAAHARRAEIDLVFVDRRVARCAPGRSAPASGLPNGTSSLSDWRCRNWVEISKNASAAMLASTILPSGADQQHRIGQRVEDGIAIGWHAACDVLRLSVMQQHSMQSRRTHRSRRSVHLGADLPTSGSVARQVLSVSRRRARCIAPRPRAPSRDACGRDEGRSRRP